MENTTAVLTDAAELQPGETVLDIGCEPGPSSFATAELVGTAGKVHGVDISETFIEQAQTTATTAGVRNITFEHAYAQVVEFDQGRFDLAISRFGMMFFDDTTAAFANIGRALKLGGRLVMLCWSAPQHNPWFGMTRQLAMDVLGPVNRPAPHTPGPLAFQDIWRVTGLLEAAG
ncbi:MAG: class I SAM-dependent methyltransferase [Hyphomicrobiaceae bacterium]